MNLLHVYGQPMEHMPVRIVGNTRALRILVDTIREAIGSGRGDYGDANTEFDDALFTSDGEGYSIEVICNDDNWHSPFWSEENLPFYHRIFEDYDD